MTTLYSEDFLLFLSNSYCEQIVCMQIRLYWGSETGVFYEISNDTVWSSSTSMDKLYIWDLTCHYRSSVALCCSPKETSMSVSWCTSGKRKSMLILSPRHYIHEPPWHQHLSVFVHTLSIHRIWKHSDC